MDGSNSIFYSIIFIVIYMKHLTFNKSVSEQFAETIGEIAKESVMIALGFLVVIARLLFKFRKFEWKLAIFIGVFYFLYAAFPYYASAPKTAYALNGLSIPLLNPNVDQREEVKALIKKIWGKDAYVGLNIARCESGYRPNAKNHNSNGTWDLGSFQINSVHDIPEMLNPVANISYAYTLYLQQGTNPWTSSEKCWGVYVK